MDPLVGVWYTLGVELLALRGDYLEHSYEARKPFDALTCFSHTIMIGIAVLQLIRVQDHIGYQVFWICMIIVFVTQISLLVYWRLRPRFYVTMGSDSLTIGETKLCIADIDRIFIHKRTVGVKTWKNWFVPMKQCFVFTNENEGDAELLQWAQAQQIETEHRRFKRWV